MCAAYLAGFGFILIVCGGMVYVKIGRGKVEFYWISKIGEDNLMVYDYSPSRPVHAKVYISDGQVAIGSANLTNAGLQKSVESLAIIKSDALSKELAKKLGTLEESFGLKRIPTNMVGSQVRITRTSHQRVRHPVSA